MSRLYDQKPAPVPPAFAKMIARLIDEGLLAADGSITPAGHAYTRALTAAIPAYDPSLEDPHEDVPDDD